MLRAHVTKLDRSARLNTGAPGRADAYQVASVSKALELLAAFSLDSAVWSLSDLARRLQVPKSTAHNLLRTLKQFDLVRQSPESRLYQLGPRALELGLIFVKKSGMLAQVKPVLRKLLEATGETCKFGMLSNDQVVIVAAMESNFQLHTRGDVGTRWDLHSTSLGKAILAALPDEEALEIIARKGLPGHTRKTITRMEAMQREMALIRKRGYALDLEENEVGVRCVAAAMADPLRGTVSAISVSGPRDRITDERIKDIAELVTTAVRTFTLHNLEERE